MNNPLYNIILELCNIDESTTITECYYSDRYINSKKYVASLFEL